MKSRLQILSLSLSLYIYNLCVVREMSCATRSSLNFLTSSFAAETYGWEGGLQSSFGGAEQPQMIELLVYNVGGQLVLRGQLVLGPDILGGHTRSPRTSCPGEHFYGGTSCLVTPEFWSRDIWSPGPKFSVEKWSPRTHSFFFW